jgi:N-methylhydantoinase A
VPTHAAVFSAWGMLLTDIRRDYTLTELGSLTVGAGAAMRNTFERMQVLAATDFEAQSMNAAQLGFGHFLDLRYTGQEHTVKVPLELSALDSAEGLGSVSERFHRDHEIRYTYRLPAAGIEVVNFHLVASVHVVKPKPQLRAAGKRQLIDARLGEREVFFEHHGVHRAVVYDSESLDPGMKLSGPAIVQDASSSLVLPPGHSLSMDSYGNLVIELQLDVDKECA